MFIKVLFKINIEFLNKISHLYDKKILSVISSFNLTQIMPEHTMSCVSCYSVTLIDLNFVSSTKLMAFSFAQQFLPWLMLITLVFTTKSPKESIKSVPRNIWQYSLADWDSAAELLDCIEWDSLLYTIRC